jgi:preprotein translocase subunit Sss1
VSAIERLVARSQTEGIEWFSASELALLREHLESLNPDARVRACYHFGATRIAEMEVDHVWTRLARKPTRAEYLALAELLHEAAAEVAAQALEVA